MIILLNLYKTISQSGVDSALIRNKSLKAWSMRIQSLLYRIPNCVIFEVKKPENEKVLGSPLHSTSYKVSKNI